MNGKIINFKEQRLKMKTEKYKEELQINYVIGKRVKKEESKSPVEVTIEQYDLYNIQTLERYMDLVIYRELGLVNISYANSEFQCALGLDPCMSKADLEQISINEIEQIMSYIQFTENDFYVKDL